MKTPTEYLKENEFIPNEHGNFIYSNGAHSASLIHILQEYASIYADKKIKSMPIFRICSHCNTEFELTSGVTINERVSTFQNCTHCGKRNDTWISLRIEQ